MYLLYVQYVQYLRNKFKTKGSGYLTYFAVTKRDF